MTREDIYCEKCKGRCWNETDNNATQKAAHEILCGKCQCCSVHGQCMKVNNSGCMYWQPIPDTEAENK